MENILNDPLIEPTLDVLKNGLGSNFTNYQTMLELIEKYALTIEWRYYKDGKSWLCKVQRKKKTILWLSVWTACFKISFFFTQKNVESIVELPIADVIKQEFLAQKAVGKLLPIIIAVNNEATLTDIESIMKYKLTT